MGSNGSAILNTGQRSYQLRKTVANLKAAAT
jgi:hypothetical protein